MIALSNLLKYDGVFEVFLENKGVDAIVDAIMNKNEEDAVRIQAAKILVSLSTRLVEASTRDDDLKKNIRDAVSKFTDLLNQDWEDDDLANHLFDFAENMDMKIVMNEPE